MRSITIPESVEIKDESGKTHLLTFRQIIEKSVYDVKFGRGPAALESSIRIMEAFELARAGDQVILISDEDWQRLVKVVRSPTEPYNPRAMHRCMHFIEAITGPGQVAGDLSVIEGLKEQLDEMGNQVRALHHELEKIREIVFANTAVFHTLRDSKGREYTAAEANTGAPSYSTRREMMNAYNREARDRVNYGHSHDQLDIDPSQHGDGHQGAEPGEPSGSAVRIPE